MDDPDINEVYDSRTWVPGRELDEDLIELGKAYEIPVQHARTKFLGPDDHAAIDSLAGRIDQQNQTLDRMNRTLTRLDTRMEDVDDLKERMKKVATNQIAAGIAPSSATRTTVTATAGGGVALLLLEIFNWARQFFNQ